MSRTGRTTTMLNMALSRGTQPKFGKTILIVAASYKHAKTMIRTLMQLADDRGLVLTKGKGLFVFFKKDGKAVSTFRFATWDQYVDGSIFRGMDYSDLFIDHYCLEI